MPTPAEQYAQKAADLARSHGNPQGVQRAEEWKRQAQQTEALRQKLAKPGKVT